MSRKLKSATATELPSNDNYEDLPALPKYIDTWLSDVVSPVRQPDLYQSTVDYTLGLMVEWGEDGSRTFEAYAPYVVGFLDAHKRASKPHPDASDPAPRLAFKQYKPPDLRSLLPEK